SGLQVDGAERKRKPGQCQVQHRLVAGTGGEAAVERQTIVGYRCPDHSSIPPVAKRNRVFARLVEQPQIAAPARGRPSLERQARVIQEWRNMAAMNLRAD